MPEADTTTKPKRNIWSTMAVMRRDLKLIHKLARRCNPHGCNVKFWFASWLNEKLTEELAKGE